MLRRLLCLAVAIASAAAACTSANNATDFQMPPLDAGTQTKVDSECANFDAPSTFQKSCAGSSCHEGKSAAAGLDLVSPGVASRVFKVPAKSCGLLADPASPESSVIYDRLSATPKCGTRMPMGGPYLSDSDVRCVRDWISGLSAQGDGGPSQTCAPGATQKCPYSGPKKAENVGICADGVQTCQAAGTWGECGGEVLPYGDDCSTPEDEDCDGTPRACGEEWAFGVGNADSQSIGGVGADADGNVYVLGEFENTVHVLTKEVTSSGPKHDVFLAKVSHSGSLVWVKSFGDSSNQTAGGLTLDDQGNVIIVGRAFGKIDFGGGPLPSKGTDDVYIAKFDGDGNHLWSKMVGGIDPDRSERVTTDSNGDVYVTGAFGNTASFGTTSSLTSAGMRDAFVIKLSSQHGALQFQKQIGGAQDDYGWGIAALPDGSTFVGGEFAGSLTVDGITLTSAGDADAFLFRLDPNGKAVWGKSFGGTGVDRLYDLRAVGQDVAFAGYFSDTMNVGSIALTSQGKRDIFIAKVSGSGTPIFAFGFGDAEDQLASNYETDSWDSLAADKAGNLYLAGRLAGAADFAGEAGLLKSAGETDAYVVQFDPHGKGLWAQRFGERWAEMASSVAVDGSGHVILGGRTFGNAVKFNVAGAVWGLGHDDGFVSRLKP